MSWHYCYYIGLENKQTKIIEPFGIYDSFNKLIPVIDHSRSFATDIKDCFYDLPNEKIGDKLREIFEYEDWNGNKVTNLRYCPIDELPSDNFIVDGYFLIDEVKAWEKSGCDDLFCNVISPQMYIELVQKQLMFGKNEPKKDDEEFEYTEPNASDYMYHSIPNVNSKEYDSFLLKTIANILLDYNYTIKEKYDVVIIESQG